MLTGQDADWHYMNYPGPASFDGPGGFLLDGINWAGSGSGMGLVQLGFDTGDCVINCEPSMTTGGGYTVSGLGGTQNVIIPAAQAGFPINTGLTSAGLSNWSTSAHNSYFVTNTGLWDGINLDGSVSSDPCTGPSCDYVTIVSAASAGGTITPTPEPASLLLFGSAAALAAGLIRRKKRA
jgi:hypothetical protein